MVNMQPTDGSSRLVEDEQLAPAHNRTRKRKDLPLPDRQVRAPARNLAVERDPRLVRLALDREQARGAERIVQHRVVVLPEGVKVLAECASEQLRLRWCIRCG